MKLTDRACRAAEPFPPPKKAPRKLSDGSGLQLWVMPSGAKYWRYKYRIANLEKVLALGVYPDLSLASAREAHRSAYNMVVQGIDPALMRKERKMNIRSDAENTFNSIAEEWLEKRKKEIKSVTVQKIEGRLRKDVLPEIGNIPIKDITPLHLLHMIRKIENRGAYEMARASRQYCGQILRYAVATGRAERDYTADIKEVVASRKITHQPALSPDELPEFLKALRQNECRLYLQTRLALKLLLLTFVRPMELAAAEWKEFDFKNKLWIIPGEKTKMSKDHVVPLSNQSLELFERLKELNGKRAYVFVNQNHPGKHMSRDALSKAVRNLGFQGRHTPHGFRALARTAIREKLNYDSEVIERQLAHLPGTSLGRTYDRTQFIDKRMEMMQDWADYIDTIKL